MGRDGHSVVAKAALVFERFVECGRGALAFQELLEGTRLSRTSLHRTLSEMVEHGLLTQVEQGENYRLGPTLLSVAALASHVSELRDLALPSMKKLRDRTRESVVLAQRHGSFVIPIQRVDGLYEMRMNQEVGRRYPLHAGATGKVLLAHGSHDWLRATSLKRLTDLTVVDHAELDRQLEVVRAAGIAVTCGERVPDAVAIAAPIFSVSGDVVAALTVSGVASRYDRTRLESDALRVKEEAQRISGLLGYRSRTGGWTGFSTLKRQTSPARAALVRQCDVALSRPRDRALPPVLLNDRPRT